MDDERDVLDRDGGSEPTPPRETKQREAQRGVPRGDHDLDAARERDAETVGRTDDREPPPTGK